MTRSGTLLLLDGKPFQPVGYNPYRLTSISAVEHQNRFGCGKEIDSVNEEPGSPTASLAPRLGRIRHYFDQVFDTAAEIAA